MFVFGRAAGKLTRCDQKRTAFAQGAFISLKRGLDQCGLDQVVIDITQPANALVFEAKLRIYAA